MNSRMEKYDAFATEKDKSRTSKNRRLYEEVSRIDVDYIDLNNAEAFNMEEKANDYSKNNIKLIDNLSDIKSYEDDKSVPDTTFKKDKLYDINEILKRAKEELKHDEDKKRLINTEYNILTKLDIEKIEKEQDLKPEEVKELVEEAYPKVIKEDDKKELFEDLTAKDKQEVEDIINTKEEDINISSAIKTKEVKVISDVEKETTSEKVVEKSQKTFFDTEVRETELIKLEKKNRAILAVIIIIVLLMLAAGTYLILKYFDII